MKRYNNLYKQMYSMENIELAHKNARKGKSHYSEVKMVNNNTDKYFTEIHEMLKNKTFKNSEYKMFIKTDSKKSREILKLPYFPDRIIHHCIMNILEPIWMKILIKDTYSSLKGRGIHKGLKRIKQALEDREGTQYCLKIDVKKFYPSIDHNILKQIIRKKIKDEDILWLLDEIIDSASGVPIGNYLSQYFGNLYLSGLDHWLKEQKGCKYYFRYCDDLVILHHDKNHLSNLRKEISEYLKTELNLELKSNWQVFPTNVRGIDFLGYRFFHDYTLVRKSIVKNFKKKMKKTKSIEAIASYKGWFLWADTYNLKEKYL